MRSSHVIGLTVTLATAVSLARAGGPPQYEVIDIGSQVNAALGSVYNWGHDINESGQVIGWYRTSNGINRSYFLDPVNGITDIGSPSGSPTQQVYARSLNESGQVMADIGTNGTAYRWEAGSFTAAGPAYGTGRINDAGQIVSNEFLGGRSHAWIWDEINGRTDLGSLGAGEHTWTTTTSINNAGQVAATSVPGTNPSGPKHIALWDAGVLTDLGTAGGTNAVAYTILDNGDILGYSDFADGTNRPVKWDADTGSFVDLGSLGASGGFAYAGNTQGDIVGISLINASTDHAFLWRDDVMYDLNALNTTPGWTLRQAWAITESGYILGQGVHEGQVQTFLLRPIPSPAAGLPLGVCLLSSSLLRRARSLDAIA